ncbi:MAG: hypothetical protein PWP65_1562 [Clostridia bacterium]|nr:hypothetical protein [Clostridia bacterium]
MLKKKVSAAGNNNITTVIGRGTKFLGKINTEESLRIDGYFEGEIEAGGDLTIGDSGHVEATISARNLVLAGTLKGNVRLAGRLEIAPTGRMIGDVQVQELLVEPGGILSGNCLMQAEAFIEGEREG